jgi:hypothetical protein
MLDLLYTDERFHQVVTPYWKRVLADRDAFLSKKVRYSYTGFAFSQLKRIKTARAWLLNPPKKKPERSDFGLPGEKILTKDNIGAYLWIMANLLDNSIEYLNLTDATKEELGKVNWIGLAQQKGVPERATMAIQELTAASDAWMEAMKKEQGYMHAKRHWDAYQSWKQNRNKYRAILEEKCGYDAKHAATLIRLMRMGKEIISEGKVIVYRPDRDELKAIRNGCWTYDQVEEYAHTMEAEITRLSATSKLPEKPNKPALDKLCVDIIQSYLSNK